MKYRLIHLIFVVAFLGILTTTMSAETYVIQPQDTIEVKVTGRSDLNTKQRVSPDGTISLPLVGRIHIEGNSLTEADALVKNKYSAYLKNAKVAVIVEPSRGFVSNQNAIFVSLHDVNKNTVEVKKVGSVAEALAYAAGHRYSVMRGNRDLGKISDLRAGDVVTVKIGREPDWLGDNWYKLLSGAGIAIGIMNSINR